MIPRTRDHSQLREQGTRNLSMLIGLLASLPRLPMSDSWVCFLQYQGWRKDRAVGSLTEDSVSEMSNHALYTV